MADLRFSHKPFVFAVGLTALAVGAVLWTTPERLARAAPVAESATPADTLTFDVRYGRAGAERAEVDGAEMVWRARAGGRVPGWVTIRVAYAGDPADRGMPVWPVNAWLDFSADDSAYSFAAELSGSLSWRSGEMRVAGLVTDGVRRDTAVEHRMSIARPGLNGLGTVVFFPPLAVIGR
jgi:hypothetical protein